MGSAPTIFLSAAEASGDDHAARLIAALRRRVPDARIVGVAGPRMAAAGCEVVEDLTAHASMLGGPLLKLGYYYRAIARIKKSIRDIRPNIHVPVDSPALNWHLAAAAKSVGARVVHYIAPQVWAWAPWRVKKLARLTDHVMCILPFEQQYLRDRGVSATYVGHPLFDDMPPRPTPPADIVEAFGTGNWRVALLPGSRPGEIAAHSPALHEVARWITRRWKNARCVFTARDDRAAEAIREICGPDVDIAVGNTRQVLAKTHFAVAVSGTVTLEVAYFGVPMVIFYRVGAPLRMLKKLVGRWIMATKYLSLVNILSGRRMVPEIMPWNGRPGVVLESVKELMNDLGWLLETRDGLVSLCDTLTPPAGKTASDAAAEIICSHLSK